MKTSVLPTEHCCIIYVIYCVSVSFEKTTIHLDLKGPETCPHANMKLVMPVIWLKYRCKTLHSFCFLFIFATARHKANAQRLLQCIYPVSR